MQYILVVDDSAMDRQLARNFLETRPGLTVEFASNGLEAVEHLEASTPLAVVSDLQMPEMDGLALVRVVRQRFPTVPVVLMTAHGSEELAVEALVAGAADYVPKRRLAADLARAVDGVLTVGRGEWQREQMMPFLRHTQWRYELPCDLDLIPSLVNQLLWAATAFAPLAGADRVRLAKCLAEAVRNAIIHGAAGDRATAKPEAQVSVVAELSTSEGKFVIRDPGPGFNAAAIVDPRRSPNHLSGDAGKGLALMQLFMDEVRFNSAGNEITLVKRWNRSAA